MTAIYPTQDPLEALLIEAICMCSDLDGWSNLAEVGTYLRKSGVKYGKLSEFMDTYEHLFSRRTNTNVNPPSVYVRLNNPPH